MTSLPKHILVGVMVAIAGCGGDTPPDESEATPEETEMSASGARVFDSEHVAVLQIEVSDSALETLRDDGAKPFGTDDFTYVPARITYDGDVFEDVGIRVKGNSSRLGLGGQGKPSDGFPYKLDFNRFVEGQELDGQTKINLHNNESLNEYLSYGAFRAAGVPASRTGWADVTLNGVDLGLYTLVEQVNERMLSRHFMDPEGALYKPEPPVGFLAYQGEDIEAYGDLGYKADAETDHAAFLELVRTLEQTEPEEWDEVIDLESVLTYFAGNVALGNWDTYVAMGHNYYLFEDDPGHFVMLPWDLNLSQAASSAVCPSAVGPGGFPGGAPPELPEGFDPSEGFPEGLPVPEGFPEGFDPSQGLPDGLPPPGAFPGFGAAGGAPLHDRLMSNERLFARYLEVLESFLGAPGSEAELNAAIDVVVPVLGERLPIDDVEALRGAIADRVTALQQSIPTTASCSADPSE